MYLTVLTFLIILLFTCALVISPFASDKPTAIFTVITLGIASISTLISARSSEITNKLTRRTLEIQERTLKASEDSAKYTEYETQHSLQLSKYSLERAQLEKEISDTEKALENFYYPLKDYIDKKNNRQPEEIAYISKNRYLAIKKTREQFNKFRDSGFNPNNEIFEILSSYVTDDIEFLEDKLSPKRDYNIKLIK